MDDTLWPQDRDLKLFKAWCQVKVHGIIIELVDEPLLHSDFEDL